MKKQLITLFTTLFMVMTFTMTAFAEEESVVTKAYTAYEQMKEALNSYDLNLLKSSYDDLEKYTYDFTDEQSSEWEKLIEEKETFDVYFDNAFKAAYIIDATDKYTEFLANKNVKTAMDFVESYEEALEINAPIDKMKEDIAQGYNDAKTLCPSEDVIAVYENYLKVKEVLEYQYVSDMEDVIEDFNKVLDTFNGLGVEERSDLATLMGVNDGEEAFNDILSDWIDINIVYSFSKVYDEYGQNQNKKTATNYIEKYESIFKDKSYEDLSIRQYIREIYADVDDSYKDAKNYLSLNGKGENNSDKTDKETNNADNSEVTALDNVPKTGDNSKFVLAISLMGISGIIIGYMMRRNFC